MKTSTQRLPKIGLCAAALLLGLCAHSISASAQRAEQRTIPPPPKDAPYVLPDGTIYYAGNDLVAAYFEKLDALFVKAHPGFKLKSDMLDSNLALPGIISGKSAMGPIGREAMQQELDGFTALYGYSPADILIGYDQTPNVDIFPPGKTPSALWINAKNPLPALSLEQVTRILKTGNAKGDITYWGQLGLGGEWAHRAIHIYMPGNRDAAFVFYQGDKIDPKLPYTRRIEWLQGPRDVMSAVAQDPFGIGLMGYWPPDTGWDREAELGKQAKIVALRSGPEDKVSHAEPGDLYPLAPGIHIYFNRVPGKPVEPWLKEYIRLALSKQGQDLLVSILEESGNNFIRLDEKEIARQLAKLE